MTPTLGAMPGAHPVTGAGRDAGDAAGDGEGFARAMRHHETAPRESGHEPARAPARESTRTHDAERASTGRNDATDTQAGDATGDTSTGDNDDTLQDVHATREDACAAAPACETRPDAAAAERMLALLTGLSTPPVPTAATGATAASTVLPPALQAPVPATPATATAAGTAGALAAMLPASTRDPAAPVAPSIATFTAGAALDALRETEAGALPATDAMGTPLAALTGATPALASAPRAAVVLDAVAMPAAPADGFDDAFGARIAWMAEQKLGHAELRVSPDNAGPIDIRLQVDGTRIRAEFNAVQADTRAALEASIPRLRDMLGQHGLELSHADVGQRQAGQGDARGGAPREDADAGGHEPVMTPAQLVRSRGLLDEYA